MTQIGWAGDTKIEAVAIVVATSPHTSAPYSVMPLLFLGIIATKVNSYAYANVM